MQRRSVLMLALGLTLNLGVLHYLALTLYLYWTLTWYDILMHFIGGLTLGVFIVYLLGMQERGARVFITLIASVLVVGGAWEVLEYIFDIAVTTEPYLPDTSLDLVMDTLGGVVAYLIAVRPRQSF